MVESAVSILARCAAVETTFISNSGSLEFIIEVILKHKANDTILLDGCRFITCCSKDSRLGHGMIDAGVLGILTCILTKVKQDPELVESSLVAI